MVGGTYSATTLTGCYATGNVTLESNNQGSNYAGGVVGSNTNSSTLIACYATGSVSGSGSGTIYVGGITGINTYGPLTACYWSCLPDNDNGGATKVDGTVTWGSAITLMNQALQSADSAWQYEIGEEGFTYIEETVNRRVRFRFRLKRKINEV